MSTTGSEIEDLPLDLDNGEEKHSKSIADCSEDFISKPTLSENCTLPANILEFNYSFGYDCKKYYNLTVADENILIFVSGNLINFFNVRTKEFNFRRSAFGNGIGHITKNPNPQYPHIAVGENGIKPPIIIYEWPSFKIVCLLPHVAEQCFTHLAYSPDGVWLASQSGKPDFLLTVYDWAKKEIIVQAKSHEEIYRVVFSPTTRGHLASCGKHHIKFWKMVKTFCGLKFEGQEGRFGATEFSDVLGVYLMPDQTIVSGCEWGNILLWENGVIKAEVSRRLGKRCHEAPITDFFYKNGDLWSIGMDGKIQIWYYKHLSLLDLPEDDRFLRIELSYQFDISNVMFMSIIKENYDPENTGYFAQDGNGGLWHIDLNIDADPQPPVQLYRCHAGAVVDIATCPWGPYLASLGADGRLQLYQYMFQKLIFVYQYPAKGTSMIWLPLKVQSSGDQLIMGFDDGNLRVVALHIPNDMVNIKVTTIKLTKPHNRAITKTTINNDGTILVTGSEDSTIFIYQVKSEPNMYSVLIPIGYLSVPGSVSCLSWHHKLEATILVGCVDGYFLQVETPKQLQPYTTVSYSLKLKYQQLRLISSKDQMEHHGKPTHKTGNSKSEDDVSVTSEVSNQILWIQTMDTDAIWLSASCFGVGYIYEYNMDQIVDTPTSFQMTPNGNGMNVNSYVYNFNKEYLILALQDGSIRIVRTNPDDWQDLYDYWQLSMHDNRNGFIPRLCFSFDEKYLFSCGDDGNIFSYKFNPKESEYSEIPLIREEIHETPTAVADVNGYTNLSLEEMKAKTENDRIEKEVTEHREALLKKLEVLRSRFQEILKRNTELKSSQVIPRSRFEVDPRITAHSNEQFRTDLQLVERKLGFEVKKSEIGMEKLKNYFTDTVDSFPISVEGIQIGICIGNARQRKLSDKFYDAMDAVEKKMKELDRKMKWEKGIKIPERPVVAKTVPAPIQKKEKELEHFLNGLSPSTIEFKLGPKLIQLLQKYRMRKLKLIKRQEEWHTINMLKPSKGFDHSKNEATLARAIGTIGDYKLKSAPDYKVPRHLWKSTVSKYKQMLDVRLEQYNMRHGFNLKLYDLREKKVQLIKYLQELDKQLVGIQNDLGEQDRKMKPPIPEITDFPENNVDVIVYSPESQEELQTKKKNQNIIESPKADLLEQEVLATLLLKGEVINSNDGPLFVEYDENSDFDDTDVFSQCPEFDTPWEVEARDYRQSRKLFEQELILKKIQKAVKAFDAEVQKLAGEKLKVTRDADFLDLHLLTLYQELYILQDLESDEEQLQVKVNEQRAELQNIGNIIDAIKKKIKKDKEQIDQLQKEKLSIQSNFTAAVVNNKFLGFLQNIFNKKHDVSYELTSTMETISAEGEQINADLAYSREDDVKLDENICPKDCNPALYAMAFTLRSKRYELEVKVAELQANVELLTKELDNNFNNIEAISNTLKNSEEKLSSFQTEKQKKLNQVMCVVVFQLHQLQHLDQRSRVNKIGDALVFSKSALSKLYKRVGQLHNETLLQKVKHRINMNHLCRVKTDCRYMEKRIEKLKAETVEKMKIKFGRVVNLDEIEEAQLRRMVFDLRMSQTDVKSLYEQELKLWKDKYEAKQIELKQIIKENTNRLGLLAIINRERGELVRLLSRQTRRKEHLENVSEITSVFKKDITKLSEIIKNQNKELQMLREEIKRLSMKSLQVTKDQVKEKFKTEEEEEPEDLFQWKDWSYEIMRESSAPACIITKVKEPEDDEERREEEEPETSRLYTTEVQIPSVLSDEAEDRIKALIVQMLTSTEHYQKSSMAILDGLAEQILQDVLGLSSFSEIADCLRAFLPEETTDVQKTIIENTARQILSLQEHENELEDIWQPAREILDEIIDEVRLAEGTPQDLLIQFLQELVEQLPIEFLLKQEIVETMSGKIKDKLLINEPEKEELILSVINIAGDRCDEIRLVFDKIWENIFGIVIIRATKSVRTVYRRLSKAKSSIMSEVGKPYRSRCL